MELTARGRQLAVLGLVVVVVGGVLGQPGLVAIGAAAGAAVVVAAVLVVDVPVLTLDRRSEPSVVARGQPAEVVLHVAGAGRRARPATGIETVDGHDRRTALPALGPGRRHELRYPVDTSRRGCIEAGPMRLHRTDPCGLVVAHRLLPGTCQVLVRPRQLPLARLPVGRRRDLDGPTKDATDGSATFHQLRDYVPGDDARRIDWKATARTGDLIVRDHVDTTRPDIVIVVDDRARAVSDHDFEEVVDLAATVVVVAERAGFPVAVHFAAGADSASPSVAPLDRLTAAERRHDDSLHRLADALDGTGRSLVVITSELDTVDLPVVARLSQGFTPAHFVSIVRDRRMPFVAPPAMQATAATTADAVVADWNAGR